MQGLFDDLLIIDCASFIAAPAAATVFSDFGARVIKIEPPGGEGYRQFVRLPGMPPSEYNYPWEAINRNKENLCIDLKSADGHAALMALVERADVFVTNYPLPVRQRLRVDPEHLRARNPRLIYASFTPYGEQGPDADLTGYDATAWWARSGLMDAVRASSETEPAISVPGMGDYPSGMSLFAGIMAALYRREKTGLGGVISSSLLANGLWSNTVRTQAAMSGADMQAALVRGQRSAFTELYRCQDKRWFLLTILPQSQAAGWPKLVECVGRAEWSLDPRFSDAAARRTNNGELLQNLEAVFATKPRDHWTALFDQHGITYGLVATPADQLADPQPRDCGMFVEYADRPGSFTVNSPLQIDHLEKVKPVLGAALGANTRSILGELGFDQHHIDAMISSGAAQETP